MVELMHALQHLNVPIVSCQMSRRKADIALHSQTTWHQLMQPLQRLEIARVRATLRVVFHTVMVIASIF
jgi:hypothetical protein